MGNFAYEKRYEFMKKKILRILLCGVLLVSLVGCGKSTNNSDVTIKDWQDTYYYYLKNLVELNPIEVEHVGFLDSKISDVPIMYVEEKRTDETANNLSLSYYYIKENTVTFLGGPLFNEYPKVEFLYNTQKDEYAYYIIEIVNNIKSYTLLESRLQSYAEYPDKDDFGQTYYRLCDDGTIQLEDGSKKNKDEIFIETNIEENFFEFTNDREEFRKKLENYKTQDEFITDEVKKLIEENANSNAQSTEESSSANVIKVGKYKLKYGKYKTCYDASTCSEFTLNPDGTATFDGKAKYFRVEDYNFAQGVEEYQSGQNIYPAIIISDTKNGNTNLHTYTPYVTSPNCLLTDAELECVNYVGD